MNCELRIPARLLADALTQKKIKQLRLFATAKLQGHRAEIRSLFKDLKIHPRTGSRLVSKIVADGWAGVDGRFLFPRAWRKLNFKKRGGLYITAAPKNLKKFEALCFAMGLKKILSSKASPRRPRKGRSLQKADLPATYLTKALGLKERRFKMLKSAAQKYRFISVIPRFNIIGKAQDYQALKKNLHGVPLFKRGKHTVVPDISMIKILI